MAFNGLYRRIGIRQAQSAWGLPLEMHVRRIHPWSVRLRAAVAGLNAAIRRSDRLSALRYAEDVHFWIGRLTADVLSASENPRYAATTAAGTAAIVGAYRAIHRARRFLLG